MDREIRAYMGDEKWTSVFDVVNDGKSTDEHLEFQSKQDFFTVFACFYKQDEYTVAPNKVWFKGQIYYIHNLLDSSDNEVIKVGNYYYKKL